MSYLCLVLVSGWWWPHKMNFKFFLPLQFFLKNLRRVGINFNHFKFLLLFFNWRINALQTFVSFFQISTWICNRYTYVPSLLNLPHISINRWMDKEIVVHIHNRILLSHKKEHIWASSDEVDKPRIYYTEWSESEKVILYIWVRI